MQDKSRQYPKRQLTERSMQRGQTGVTLVELLVTLAVAAILMAAAVPSFNAMLQNNRAAAQVNEFVTTIHLARSEAMKRGNPVTICASNNQRQCNAGTAWTSGWVLFEDTNANGAPAAPGSATDARLIRVWYPLEGGSSLTGDVNYLRFFPNGTATWASTPGASRSFALDVPKCSGDQKREVSVNRLGHVATKRLACS